MNWVHHCLIAVLFFSLGTMIVTYCMKRRSVDATTSAIILGLVYGVGAIALLLHGNNRIGLRNLDGHTLFMLLVWAALFYVGANLYMKAIREAENPGFARAIMATEIVLMYIAFIIIFGSKLELIKMVGIGCVVVGSVLIVI